MQLDQENGKPLFMQLAEGIEEGILKDIYPEETQIPSTNEIAVSLKLNPATINRGVNLLVDAGIVYKKRGLGMFVCPGGKERVLARRRQAFCQTFILPLLQEAGLLGFSRDEVMDLVKQTADAKQAEGAKNEHD